MTEIVTPHGNRESMPRNEDLPGELLHIITATRHEQDASDLETEIRSFEEALGIRTTPGRLIEAGLAVDRKFLDVAIITGQPARPERIFGNEEWAGHLKARLFARQYGDQPLTIDFILALHQCYLDMIEPGRVGTFVDGCGGKGGQFIDGQFAPITCTEEQIAIINSNPLLSFGRDEGSDLPNTGYIYYIKMTAQERRERLGQICDRYNYENKREDISPFAIAAGMQQRLVSLHPLTGGMLTGSIMGRLSRTLMNWSLENAGESPSIIDDVDGDLFLPEESWVESVKAGSGRYAKYKRRIESGETNPVVLFDLEREKLRYEELLSSESLMPPALVGDDWHDHSLYEKFLSRLRTVA